MSKTKMGIYQKQITSRGGEISLSIENATHIIVSDSAKLEVLESMLGPMKELKSKLVTTSWLRVALSNGRIHDEELYSPAPTPKKPAPSNVHYNFKWYTMLTILRKKIVDTEQSNMDVGIRPIFYYSYLLFMVIIHYV